MKVWAWFTRTRTAASLSSRRVLEASGAVLLATPRPPSPRRDLDLTPSETLHVMTTPRLTGTRGDMLMIQALVLMITTPWSTILVAVPPDPPLTPDCRHPPAPAQCQEHPPETRTSTTVSPRSPATSVMMTMIVWRLDLPLPIIGEV